MLLLQPFNTPCDVKINIRCFHSLQSSLDWIGTIWKISVLLEHSWRRFLIIQERYTKDGGG
ncbi:hypothetical protein EG329_009116 [Mollisiaceae sp. DMI_Dod_QoI]|nr:hypothetical protein EG329_009116 [Helotiales sp. DMI_Dod_QoI]